MANPDDFLLIEKTIGELQGMMEAGEMSARGIVEAYLERIELFDTETNCMIETNPDALSIADGLDAERKGGSTRGMLHGIPIVLKANIDTADQMATSAGSLALQNHMAKEDAQIVTHLRSAGAIILGKANLSEWANFRSTRSSSGWSGIGGQTRNPYALDRSPSGSSSGSGVAVSSNFCAGAIGTETDGSVVSPSNVNGIVGIKPTLGLLSQKGIIPIAHSQDTAGPMARTVADAAILLGGMCGQDFAQYLGGEIENVKLGVDFGFLGRDPRIKSVLQYALSTLKSLGVTLGVTIEEVSLNLPPETYQHELNVLQYEYKADLNKYLSTTEDSIPIKSIADLHQFNIDHADSEMPYFGQERISAVLDLGDLTTPDYKTALAQSKHLTQTAIDTCLHENNLHAIISATGGPAWLIDWLNGDSHAGGGSCSSPAAISGYPHITVPMGDICGMPIGISFFAGANTEPTLIKIAYGYEQASKARRTPQFLPTAKI